MNFDPLVISGLIDGSQRYLLDVSTGMSEKKREPKLFSKKSQNFGPTNLKTYMNNLNTHKFQHIKYKILNLKTF